MAPFFFLSGAALKNVTPRFYPPGHRPAVRLVPIPPISTPVVGISIPSRHGSNDDKGMQAFSLIVSAAKLENEMPRRRKLANAPTPRKSAHVKAGLLYRRADAFSSGHMCLA